jgi:hypothetical protein
MVPEKSDPRWEKFLRNMASIPVGKLPTKMLITRLKMLEWDKSDNVKKHAISEAYDFFSKNKTVVEADIKLIFG